MDLNKECQCISLDADKLKTLLDQDAGPLGLYSGILRHQPHLFSAAPVFVDQVQVSQMRKLIDAIESVVALPAYQESVLTNAPAIAKHAFGPRGVFLGYDFHLGAAGPQLIEINTNAGGGLLNAIAAQAQKACCPEVEYMVAGLRGIEKVEADFLAMFQREWAAQRGTTELRTLAIVDDDPQAQYLYPEFQLFKALFERAGFQAVIADAKALEYREGKVWSGNVQVDFVYNRLTDFYFDDPAHAALRAAYEAGNVVVSPHPRSHALYADKRNLITLSNGASLASLGVDAATVVLLTAGIPRTVLVTAENADTLWSERKRLFFKPAAGFGGKAAYRGDKITKGVWADVLTKKYIAQVLVPPSERTIEIRGQSVPLKLDIRNYVYDGRVQLLAARLYQGQTTNFRTEGGGFAPVFTQSAEGLVAMPGIRTKVGSRRL